MLGGAVGIAVVNSVWLNNVRAKLTSVLSESQVELFLGDIDSLASLPLAVQSTVRSICGAAYNLQIHATLGFTAVQFAIILALWRKRPLRLSAEGTLEAK